MSKFTVKVHKNTHGMVTSFSVVPIAFNDGVNVAENSPVAVFHVNAFASEEEQRTRARKLCALYHGFAEFALTDAGRAYAKVIQEDQRLVALENDTTMQGLAEKATGIVLAKVMSRGSN